MSKLYVIVDKDGNVVQESVSTDNNSAWLQCAVAQKPRLGTRRESMETVLTMGADLFSRCWRACGESGNVTHTAAREIGSLMGYRLAEAEVIEKVTPPEPAADLDNDVPF